MVASAAKAPSRNAVKVTPAKHLQEEGSFQKTGTRRDRAAPGPSEGRQADQSSGPKAKKPRFEYKDPNRLTPEARAKLMEAGKCFNCQEQGHRASDTEKTSSGIKFVCPKRSNENPNVPKLLTNP